MTSASTMGTLAKPDSSYASNRLTRSNAPQGHLLSTFRNPMPKDARTKVPQPDTIFTQPTTETEAAIDIDAEPLSSDEEEIENSKADIVRPSIETKPDIDTDADPLSSDEEETKNTEHAQPSLNKTQDVDTDADPLSSEVEDSDSDSLPDRKDVNYNAKTLEEKLAEDRNSPRAGNGAFRKSRSARTLSNMMGSDEDEPLFSGSSQPSKRRKEAKYVSKASASSYFKRPPFPPRSRMKTRESSPAIEAPKEPEETFIVPKDICSSVFRDSRSGEESNSSFSHDPLSLEEIEALGGDDDSPLSSPSPSLCEELSQLDELIEKQDRHAAPTPKSLCPLCHKEVDPVLLESFRSQSKQRIRDQVQFCQSHNAQSASQQWLERGYPVIDWESFEKRVQSYFSQLEKLFVPGAFSYYRNILDESVKSGQLKNFRLRAGDGKELEMMSCGYYGPRGGTKMLEVVIRRFSVLIRRLALADAMIKAVGVAGYTQSVIVPELAVLMVKDDMKVNDEDARQILRESMEIGGLLHPDHNDVLVPEEEKRKGEDEDDEDDEEEEEEEEYGDEEEEEVEL